MDTKSVEPDPTYCPRCGFLTSLHFLPGDQGCRDAPAALVLMEAIFGPPLVPPCVAADG